MILKEGLFIKYKVHYEAEIRIDSKKLILIQKT